MSHDPQTPEELLRELLADRLPTRRDQFAMAALTGLLAGNWEDYAIPQKAVEFADATIAALDGGG